MFYDPDEWEVVIDSRPCSCGGKCNGMCNGMMSVGHKRRAPEDVARIKAEKQREHDKSILLEAAAIIARRGA